MISKLRFSLFAVIMLVLLGFGFQNQAKGQAEDSLCPLQPFTTGYTDIELKDPFFNPLLPPAVFSAGLLGQVEVSGGVLVGGLDASHTDDFAAFISDSIWSHGHKGMFPTNLTGSQIISWWTQKNGRNTYIQLTNSSAAIAFVGDPAVEVPVFIHVEVFGEACNPILNFCDPYTGWDTHEYDFSNFVQNNGTDVANLTDGEGFVVMTAVKDCDTPEELAIDHNFLSGQLVIHDSNDYNYGANALGLGVIRQFLTYDETKRLVRRSNLFFDHKPEQRKHDRLLRFALHLALRFVDFLYRRPATARPEGHRHG